MRTTLRIATIAYITYLALALVLITPALNILPHWFIEKNFGRQLQTDWVLLNPFTLSLEIRRAQLTEQNGERFTDVGEASINLSLESLWKTGWVLDALRVKDFHTHVVLHQDGNFNFSDLLGGEPETPEPEPPEAQDSGMLGLTIHDFLFHAESIVYTDQSRDKPYNSRWNGLELHVQDLSTVLEEGRPYNLDVYGEDGGKLHWEGTVSIPNAHSEGQLVLSTLSMPRLWQVAEPWLGFEIRDGHFTLQGHYEVDWKEDLRYLISSGKMGISTLDIAPVSPQELPDTGLQLKQLQVDGITLDGTAQQVTVNAITLDGLAVSGWQEDSRISLQELFAVELPEDPEAAEPEPQEAGEEGWSAALDRAKVHNSSLHWRSAFTDPAVLEVVPIEATLEQLTWPLTGDTRLSLSLAINEQASLAIDGVLALADGNGDINYKLEGLPLTWSNPNLPAALKVHFTGGEIDIAGATTLEEFSPSLVTLDGAIRNFSVHRENVETMLTGWETVRIEGLAVDLSQNSLLLEKLAIDDYQGRLHIAPDGSVNASNVWKEEVGEQVEEIAEDLSEDKPWTFSIPAILVSDSEIDFMDQSLPIPFRTVIGEVNGEILGLNSDAASSARVEIKGSVDGYAPVALVGSLNPLKAPPALDLDLSFEGVDMALLSPYSGTYAGYAIDRGLLNLHLNYALKDNQLKGQNDIRMDQLKLGDKIESDKAVDAPLELALAILTDSSGVIDMSVPVSGDVNDPEFSLGSVIGKAFLNILTKAITAPFTLLAGLVDSDEDLQRLNFSPGSTELDDATRAKLGQLAQALAQRPGLSLVITGRLNPDADRERLQKNTLKAQLVEAGLAQEELDSKGPGWEKAIAKRYSALPAAGADKPELSARKQYLAVAQSIPVSDTQMVELAEQRAVAVKTYLVNESGMAADRAVIEQSGVADEANLFSGVELDIGT